MFLRFLNFLANDGFYSIAMIVALVAVYFSDNRIKSAIFAYSFDGDYELAYFDIQGKA